MLRLLSWVKPSPKNLRAARGRRQFTLASTSCHFRLLTWRSVRGGISQFRKLLIGEADHDETKTGALRRLSGNGRGGRWTSDMPQPALSEQRGARGQRREMNPRRAMTPTPSALDSRIHCSDSSWMRRAAAHYGRGACARAPGAAPSGNSLSDAMRRRRPVRCHLPVTHCVPDCYLGGLEKRLRIAGLRVPDEDMHSDIHRFCG